MNKDKIRLRNRIIHTIRTFFYERDYLEVETPLLSPYLIPESSIEVFETTYFSESFGEHQLYLTPSPEIFMKKLIAEGYGDIFQITKSFRNYEQSGKDHNPEFTMLEWYKMGITAMDNIAVTEELFNFLLSSLNKKGNVAVVPDSSRLKPPFRRMSMEEVFYEKCGIDLKKVQTTTELIDTAKSKGYSIPEKGEDWESAFNRIFLNEIEPFLPDDKPLILYNYPEKIECLAKNIPGTPWRDRWELYAGGIELANCYSEETNPNKISALFQREYLKKSYRSRVIPDIDQQFSTLFAGSYPDCSGVALGIDRLIRIITGSDSLEGVILFPLSAILD